MSVASLQDLRRIADAVAQLTGRTVDGVEMRSDCRQLRVSLADGALLLVSALVDEDGKPRLDVDLLQTTGESAPGQLEVRFEGET